MANSLKKCKHCSEYKPAESGVKTPVAWFCCHVCAIEFAREKSAKVRERKARASDMSAKAAMRKRKIDVKPLSWFREKAKRACHAYVRARDAEMPCPCCGATEAAQWDAAHYRPAGVNSALRFDERNIHRCCQVCNQHKSGNLTPYRIWMVAKYGEDFVQSLDSNHDIVRRTRQDLEAIEAEYKAKMKELIGS